MNAPSITVEFNMDLEQFQLIATSFQRSEPAGPRLFRGGDLPAVKWLHDSEEPAIKDRDTLQKYLTLAWAGKAPRSKGIEERERPTPTKFDFSNAVWTL